MRYDQDFIEKVREANNLVDIISQYTDLKGRGSQHLGLCPFPDHNEKTPSFSVSEDKQVYHCFGCKKSGNAFTFLQTYNGLSFPEALEYLARRAHIEMPQAPSVQERRQHTQSKDRRQQMTRINREAAVFYHQNLKQKPKTHKVWKYLERRGLTQEIVDEFRLGLAPEAWSELSDRLTQKKVPMSLAESLGLIRPNRKGGHFDLFRDRLMFPIFSIDSQVIGFGGRVIDQGQPKYINSHESDVFKKGQSFYGVDKATKFIRSEDRAFVVEGYMDLLALYRNGVCNVVATLGTALTENHVRLLKRWTKNVVLLFDGDAAGREASQRSLLHFFRQGLVPQVFVLPPGEDPDDYISRVGVETFQEESLHTQDLFLHQLNLWMAGFKNQPTDKIEIIDKVAPLLNELTDRRLYQLYVEEVARHLGESPKKVYHWLISDKKRLAQTAKPKAHSLSEPNRATSEAASMAASTQEPPIDLKGAQQDELALLGLGLKSLKYLDFIIDHQGPEALGHKPLQDLFSQVVTQYRQEPAHFDKLAHLVVSKLKNPEKVANVFNFSTGNEGAERDEDMLKDCLIRVRDRFFQRQAAQLVAEMKMEPTDEKLERFVNIQNERKALKQLKKIPLGE